MFGMGGSEILVILIVALIFLGPDKLPDAAKQISKGLRDLRKQTRQIQETIENDTQIGGALRDLKSALRGDELRAPFEDMRRQVNQAITGAAAAATGATTAASDANASNRDGAAAGADEPTTSTEESVAASDGLAAEDALPVFRAPVDTFAKGALTPPVVEATGAADAANAENPAPPISPATESTDKA